MYIQGMDIFNINPVLHHHNILKSIYKGFDLEFYLLCKSNSHLSHNLNISYRKLDSFPSCNNPRDMIQHTFLMNLM